jgi:hypothetical protein
VTKIAALAMILLSGVNAWITLAHEPDVKIATEVTE